MFFHTYQTNRNFSRPIANSPDDDIIRVVCPGEVDGDVARNFLMKRSSLQRSEALNQFFQSKSYRFGCGMRLHFYNVPGICFGLVKDYLEMGSDRYTKAHMIDEVSIYYSSEGKRIETFARTYKCARQLQLSGLKTLAWEAIKDEESALTIENIISLTSLIFATQAGFGHELKEWLLEHIKQHRTFLNGNPVVAMDPVTITWTDVVSTSSPEFKKEWKSLVKDEKTPLSIVGEEDAQELVYTRVLQSLDDADLQRAERAMSAVKEKKHGTPRKTPTSPRRNPLSPHKPVITEIISMGDEDDDLSQWEDLDRLCPGPEVSRTTDDTKARVLLGAPANPRFSTSSAPSTRPSSLDLETAKARSVMGINERSPGTIAGRRKQPALSRARKSFTNLMR
jgi:hypothetical protein